jgi:hypothetical protein
MESVLTKLEWLLPNADKALLEFVAQAAVRQILNYINHDELPPELENAAVLIARAYWDKGGFGGGTQAVTSVKRGDVQTSFGEEKYAVDFDGTGFFGFRAMLDPFRKLRW